MLSWVNEKSFHTRKHIYNKHKKKHKTSQGNSIMKIFLGSRSGRYGEKFLEEDVECWEETFWLLAQ